MSIKIQNNGYKISYNNISVFWESLPLEGKVGFAKQNSDEVEFALSEILK